jgi:hypothetical protein
MSSRVRRIVSHSSSPLTNFPSKDHQLEFRSGTRVQIYVLDIHDRSGPGIDFTPTWVVNCWVAGRTNRWRRNRIVNSSEWQTFARYRVAARVVAMLVAISAA